MIQNIGGKKIGKDLSNKCKQKERVCNFNVRQVWIQVKRHQTRKTPQIKSAIHTLFRA